MFIFSVCQTGAEKALKKEIKRLFPDWRAAFSRPGFISFKTGDMDSEILLEQSVLVRCAAKFIGKVDSLDKVWETVDAHRLFINRLHCFQRDAHEPGENGFEPGITDVMLAAHKKLIQECPHRKFLGKNADDLRQPALSNETVLDVLEADPNVFMLGTHRITETSPIQALYPGGIVPLTMPDNAVSRAWLKFEEGLRWSQFDIKPDSVCLDAGSSPGGCSQVLLSRNVKVFGIDPGAMHETVLKHPHFTHIRSRIKNVKHHLLSDADWLFADMNVAPNYTLDVIGEIAASASRLKGMLFTLKLLHWELVEKIPDYIERIKKMRFKTVSVKQLAFNRQEVMVAAKR